VIQALLLSLPLALSAQQSDGAAAKQKIVADLKQSMAKNQAALKQYTWTETTQISLKGEVKKQEQKSCQYGPDGKVQKTEIPGSAPAPQQQESAGRGRRGGAVKKAVVEKEVGEMKDYMQRVAALIHEYVPPNPERIQSAAAAGNISFTPGEPAVIVIKDYLKQGDSVSLGFDKEAKRIVTCDVKSYLDKPKEDDVNLSVAFDRLPDGTNHVKGSVLDATAKQIQVKVNNSDYKKLRQ
jgi:hypothetical protein